MLKGVKCIKSYRQIPKMQNTRIREEFRVEMTIYDKLRGLKDESNRLTREINGVKPAAVDVAKKFHWELNSKDSTIKQYDATECRLPDSGIEAIGLIKNEENPDVCSYVPS